MKFPVAHGQGGYAISHRPKVVYLSDYRPVRFERPSVSFARYVLWCGLLGVCSWYNIVRPWWVQ